MSNRPAGPPAERPPGWLRIAVVTGVAWVLAWGLAAWLLLPRVAADPTVGGAVVPADWVVPVVDLVLVVVGGLVVLRDRTHRYGWLMFGMGLLEAPVVASGAWALFGTYVVPGADLPLVSVATWLQDAVAWPGMALRVLLLPALFPTGRVLAGRWGTALRVVLVSWVAFCLVFTLARRSLENWFLAAPAQPPNPTGILAVPMGLLQGWWLVTMVASALVALASVVVRWRRADGVVRQQLKWPLLAFVVLGVLVLADMADVLLVEGFGVDLGIRRLLALGTAGAGLLFVVGLGLGVLRYRLYDVDRVINRTLVYAALTVAVVAVYVLGVVGVGRLVPAVNDRGLALVVTVLVALAFDPVRRRVQAAANRWMFGQRDDPYAVLSRMGDVVVRAGTPAEALQAVVDTLAQSLKLPWVAVELHQRDGQVLRAVHDAGDGGPPAEPESVPLVHRREQVGRLLAVPRSVGERLSADDRRLLADVAHQAGSVAATARLTADLQRSRERLVLAREEERRRIRRDLHDGLGPSLAAHALALDAAADRVAGDPEVARQLLVSLKTDTQQLVADIRRLVHDLRPPALDELGLAGALVAHVARVDGAGNVAMRLRTDPDPLPELSAAVEVAAWRITREAITNVVRHADASNCTITLSARDDVVEVRVVDDGIGLPVVPRTSGVGLRSMRDRAEELGGTLSATDGPRGGTTVVATLPIGGAASRLPDVAADTAGAHHVR